MNNNDHLNQDFRECYPMLASVVFHPWKVGFVLLILAILTWSSNPVYSLAILCLWTPVFAFFLERRLLGRLLFPPFVSVVVWAGLGTGVGIPIMYATASEDIARSCIVIQCVYFGSFPFAAAGYWLGIGGKMVSLDGMKGFRQWANSLQNQMVAIGWCFFLFASFIFIAKVLIGVEDRGEYGPYGQFSRFVEFGPQIFLSIFPKLSMIGFLFIPILWKSGGRVSKSIIGLVVILFYACALVSGARGMLLYPALLFLVGVYLFRDKNSKWFEVGILVFVIAGLMITPVILAYRGSSEYRNIKSADFVERIFVLGRTLSSSFGDLKAKCINSGVGYSLFGFEDVNVYAMTPQKIPHAGVEGFDAVFYTWIPTYFARNKPRLLDAEWVAGGYKDPPIKMVGHGITLQADAFRRFSWIGIPIVTFLGFLVYGFLCRWLLSWWKRGGVFGYALVCFACLFFWSRPFGTILGTWWVFFYDTPKQLLVLALVCWLVGWLCKTKKQNFEKSHENQSEVSL